MALKEDEIIAQVRSRFSTVNTAGNDDEERELLFQISELKPEMRVLDLGTGSGYLAFYYAEQCQTARIFGLDVIEEMCKRNNRESWEHNLSNPTFQWYDGKELPYPSDDFDRIVSRFAFHHFPDIAYTAREIDRVLNSSGKLILCDCVPTPEDTEGDFIDRWMRIIGDGHVSFRRITEYENMLRPYGFQLTYMNQRVTSCIREYQSDYQVLLEAYPQICRSYLPRIENEKISLSIPVVRAVFSRLF